MNDPMNSAPRQALAALLEAQGGAALGTDDIVELVLPLFEEVAALHAQDKVALLTTDTILVDEQGILRLARPGGQEPAMDIEAVHRVQPQQSSGLNIIGHLQQSHEEDGRREVSDLAVQRDAAAPIGRPVYLPGPASWEIVIGHHDEITDVFMLGMMLASLACGLDFSDADDLARFAEARRNLFKLNDRLHPIVAAVIVEMTEVNRHDRATDVAGMTARLRNWRDQPLSLDVERALAGATGVAPRRVAVLAHLRDRLFDLSRRNRLLYFRPSASTVNLTVASVPLMLQIERIRPEQMCTWGGPFARDVVAGSALSLQGWLRFDDQPYLPPALDKLIAETRRDRAEFGFSNLRLVIAFLRWHNLKESPDERITTPLLWLPVEVSKRKGVRDQYVMQATTGDAEFNPVLRHHLHQLYDIRLPETVDLAKTTIAEIHADILAQIQRTEPSVALRMVDKPSIRLVRHKAMQRLQKHQRRRPARERARHAGWLPPFSYAQDDYRPLGRALFEQWVRPSELPQRTEAGASPSKEVRRPTMVDTVAEAPPADVESYSLEESDGHRYAWDLDLTQVTLANFNYRKMSLVRDYAQLIDDGTVNPAFDKVFSIEPRELETELPAPLPFAEQWSVVPSDATQNAAVGVARSQRSFIIQGPPGTGKSQTITNLIADYAGRGKRVLFVCEKRAALDVVFHRLKQSGLDALCCLIHDSQADKKGFITDLKAGYESWMATAHESDALATRRRVLVEALDKATRRIEGFEEAMTATPSELGVTVRSLLRRVASRPPPPAAGAARGERLPSLATWDRYHELAQRVHRAMWERFGCEGMAGHALARLAAPLVADARAFGRAEQLCGDAEALLAQLDPLLESTATLIDADMSLPVALAIAIESQWLLDTGLVAHLALLDPTSTAHAALRQIQAHAATCQDELERARADTVHWRDKLSPGDTESAFSMVQALEGSVARWFQPSWWRLRGELKRRYDFGKHAVRPGFAKILSQLGREHAAVAALEAAEAEGRKLYGVTDLAAFLSALHTLQQRAGSADAGHHALLAHLRRAIDPVAAARAEADGRAPLEKLADRVQDNLASADEATPGQLAEWVRDLREALDDLPDLLPLLRAVHTAEPAFADLLAHVNASPVELEALVSDEALLRLERLDPVVASFGGAALAQAARLMATAQRELLALNAQVICASRHQQFAANVHRSALAASQLDGEGKAFKKNYATGRRELEHEFGKSMRYRSIRDLADDETGMVINDLKPIWLMSPLSVSDTLPLSKDLFDVVIFDEASQIPTEEAVPALSRARQVVVVGDEMQLPPTSFFSASGAEGDDEVLVEDDGEKIAISLDADSLLNQAGRNLPATLLAWHYRSRHESLISFSNAAFYDGRLVTIPDRAMELAVEQPASIRSNAVDAGIEGAEALLARPISFHRLADGVYVERRNQPEAQYIAQVVREMLRRETGMSIGIVAFSEAQQGAIETALEALGTEDADFATRLEREYVREDDDQFNGLFVKNLENVQGDERDIIILSICYAPGPEGKMLMNFGPINQRGGEKRLNVIFSRARHRMAVVSTIQADAITNVHNDGAAALRTFLQFAQASATGQFERAQATLAALNRGARDTFARVAGNDSIRDQLAKALRNRGHIVSENVGRSQFRCDLAIAEPSGQGYALAILLDAPDAPVVDTVERYVFRPGVLRQFGWHVLDIPGKDWIDDQEAVIARIEGMLADGEDRALDALIDILPDIDTAPAEAGPGEEPSAEPTSDAVSPVSLRSLRFEQGTSRKFWRAQVDGLQFTVTFGRIGTQGQAQVKVFETAQRAHREMEKLVAEKLRKGYVDD